MKSRTWVPSLYLSIPTIWSWSTTPWAPSTSLLNMVVKRSCLIYPLDFIMILDCSFICLHWFHLSGGLPSYSIQVLRSYSFFSLWNCGLFALYIHQDQSEERYIGCSCILFLDGGNCCRPPPIWFRQWYRPLSLNMRMKEKKRIVKAWAVPSLLFWRYSLYRVCSWIGLFGDWWLYWWYLSQCQDSSSSRIQWWCIEFLRCCIS